MSSRCLSIVDLERIRLAKVNTTINAIERKLAQDPIEPPPVRHVFTPGLYSREIRITPAPGTAIICTSAIHKFEHQYVISKGRCSVWQEETGWVHLQAPFHGVTEPGTRRILVVWEETVWTTFHPNAENITDPEQFREFVTEPMPVGGDQ
jgi:hypothetical protein